MKNRGKIWGAIVGSLAGLLVVFLLLSRESWPFSSLLLLYFTFGIIGTFLGLSVGLLVDGRGFSANEILSEQDRRDYIRYTQQEVTATKILALIVLIDLLMYWLTFKFYPEYDKIFHPLWLLPLWLIYLGVTGLMGFTPRLNLDFGIFEESKKRPNRFIQAILGLLFIVIGIVLSYVLIKSL